MGWGTSMVWSMRCGELVRCRASSIRYGHFFCGIWLVRCLLPSSTSSVVCSNDPVVLLCVFIHLGCEILCTGPVLPMASSEHIVHFLDPFDVARLSQTCRSFRSHIYNDDRDDTLWRGLYLSQPYDDPRLCLTQDGRERAKFDWRAKLQRIL